MEVQHPWCCWLLLTARRIFGVGSVSEWIGSKLLRWGEMRYKALPCCEEALQTGKTHISCSAIRLITVESASEASGVYCRLAALPNFESPSTAVPRPYHCLSYTWQTDPLVKDRLEQLADKRHSSLRQWFESLSQGLKTWRPVRSFQQLLASHPQQYTLICNGGLLAVNANLWHALIQLWQSDHGELGAIWVDAICINQDNSRSNAEKSHQVASMHKIYLNATSVLVWLGASADDLEPVRRMGSAMKHLKHTDYWDDRWDVDQIGKSLQHFTPSNWNQVAKLMENTYWGRLWILQEIVSAKEILVTYGRTRMAWNDVCNLSIAMFLWGRQTATGNVPGTYSPHFMGWSRERFARDPVNRLRGEFGLRVLSTSRNELSCTDGHDVIYAHLGICKYDRIEDVTYEKPVSQLYTEFWADILDRDPPLPFPLNYLTCVEDASQSLHRGKKEIWRRRDPKTGEWIDWGVSSLASWVPDLHARLHPNSFVLDHGKGTFGAANGFPNGDAPPLLHVDLLKGWLSLQGFCVDIISDTGESALDLQDSRSLPQTLSMVWSTLVNENGPYSCPASKLEAFWATMAVLGDSQFKVAEDAARQECYNWLLHQWTLAWFNTPTAKWKDGHPNRIVIEVESTLPDLDYSRAGILVRNIHEYLQKEEKPLKPVIPTIDDVVAYARRYGSFIAKHSEDLHKRRTPESLILPNASFVGAKTSVFGESRLQHRRMFQTDRGYMGKGHQSLKRGDEIWILPGAQVPFILRRIDENQHMFVGHAYVHGIMQGEAASRFHGRQYEDVVLY